MPPERTSRATSRPSPSAHTSRMACIVSALRRSDTLTYWPRPVRLRSKSAEDTAKASIEAE